MNTISKALLIFFLILKVLPAQAIDSVKTDYTETPWNRPVTLNKDTLSLEQAIRTIEDRVGVKLNYNKTKIKTNRIVPLHANNEPAYLVFNRLMKMTGNELKYIEGNQYVIVPINKRILYQTVRGRVIDADTRIPLAYANIMVKNTDRPLGTTSDSNGFFRIPKVPIGRHNIQFSYMGYETKVIPELLVTSAKEMVLEVGLKQNIVQMEAVVVRALTKKDKPLNPMAIVSARTFSVEEARRYAGGFDDPSRLASSFAGVIPGTLNENALVIRGNATKGLLWQLEGVEIPNPNHLPGIKSIGGGALSALSSLVLANSDFYTGAYPAEYSNALSGVFDIKLRNGNNEKHEHAFQVGAMGIDFSSEGPLSKERGASYLFNYRYSTLALIKDILPQDLAPVYQDLCFKINLPAKKAGVFSLWALVTDDKFDIEADSDTMSWRNLDDQESFYTTFRLGAVGLNHQVILDEKTYLNSILSVTGDYTNWDEYYKDQSLVQHKMHHIDLLNSKTTLTSVLNHKYSAGHTNRTGIRINRINYKINLQYAESMGAPWIETVDQKGSSMMYNAFSQSQLKLPQHLLLNLGVQCQYYSLNKEFLLEPRAGLTCHITNKQSISLAYGNHSRLEPQFIYFTKVLNNDKITYPNRTLAVTKAKHFVMAYDLSINSNLRLKIEPYLQLLYDIPVIPDSSYSTINQQEEWFFTDKLINQGAGRNQGVDITLERFMKDGFYYLFTASIFDSKYKGGDGIERNTAFNSRFVFNVLFGKEWILGARSNKVFSVNGRLNAFGGQCDTPVIQDYPYKKGDEVVFDYTRAFSHRKPDQYIMNISLYYRLNNEKHASIWSLQLMNVLGMKEHYGYLYDYKENKVKERAFSVLVPTLSYKIEF